MSKWLQVKNAAGTGPVELLIYDQIGVDWYGGDGVLAGEFAKELGAIDRNRDILVAINSPGGNVWDGLAIYHQLQARKDRVTCRVDGIAASIASIIAMAGKELVMPENALLMVHNPYGMAVGDADAMRKTADELDKHKDALVGIYVAKTGKSEQEVREMMDAETWLTGKEAKALGFCDRLTDAQLAANSFDLSRFRRVPALATGGLMPPPNGNTNTKDHSMSDTTKTAPTAEAPIPPVAVIDPADFAKVKEQLEQERAKRITNQLNVLAASRDVDAEAWLPKVLKDESLLDILAKFPEKGTAPVKPATITVGETEPSEPANPKAAGEAFLKIKDPVQAAKFYNAHKPKLLSAVYDYSGPRNANGFTTLTHTVLSQRAVEAFIYALTPIRAFANNFSADAVARGDKVKVLYTAAADAAADWAGTYVIQDADAEGKDITINKRKYVSWGLTTEEISTQPQLALDTFATQKGNALAVAFLQDVWSQITEANYGSGAILADGTDYVGNQLTVTQANFDLDEVAALYGAAGVSNWPEMNRSLVLSIPYYTRIFRESEVIGTEGLASSNPTMLREASIPRLMGFDLYPTNAISATATDNVTGWACHPDAMMVAIRTLIPESMANSPAVRVMTDPGTGASVVMREWFDADNDQAKRVLEVTYGYAVGNTNALKMIVSS